MALWSIGTIPPISQMNEKNFSTTHTTHIIVLKIFKTDNFHLLGSVTLSTIHAVMQPPPSPELFIFPILYMLYPWWTLPIFQSSEIQMVPLCQAHLEHSCSQMWPAFSSGWRVINTGACSLSSSLLFLVASPRYTWQNCKILKCTLWLSVCIGSLLVLKAKYLPANAGDRRDVGSIPGLARSPGGGNGNPLPYSCLDNFMDWGAWQATVHGVEKELDTTEELSTVCVHCDYLICVCAEVFTSCCSEVSACWMPTPRLGSAACCDMVPPPCSQAENTFPRTFFPGEFRFRACKRETCTKLCCLSFLPGHQTVRSPGMGWG